MSNKTVTTFSLTKNNWRYEIDATLKTIQSGLKPPWRLIIFNTNINTTKFRSATLQTRYKATRQFRTSMILLPLHNRLRNSDKNIID